MAATHDEAPGLGHAAGVSGGDLQTSLSTPALARPVCPRPALLRGRGRLPTEPRSSSRRQRQLRDPSVHLEGPRPRPPGPRGSSTGAPRSPRLQHARAGAGAQRVPPPAAPAAVEAPADDEPLEFASRFVSSIVLGAISDHVLEDECLLEDLTDDDDDAASVCSGAGAEAQRTAPWEPLRLGGALPECLAFWPEEADAPARRAAVAAGAAEAAALAAAAAAASQRPAGQEDEPGPTSPRTAGEGSLSFSSASGEWGTQSESEALDDFEEVCSLCSDDAGLEEERASYAERYIHRALSEARANVDAQQPEEEPEAACDETEAGGSVIEDAETTNDDLAFDFACGMLDLSIAARSEGGLGGLADVAAASAAEEPRRSAPWGSTKQHSISESVLERMRAEFPLACARCAIAAEPAASAATQATPWGSTAQQPAGESVLERLRAEFPQACARAAAAASAPGAVAPVATSAAAAAASAPEAVAPVATPAPHTPSSKAKRRIVIGGVVRAPAGSPAEEAPPLEDRTRPSQLGSLSRSSPASASTPALALDLGDGASGKSKWSAGAATLQSACALGPQRSPSLGALRLTKKQQPQPKGPSWRAFGLAGEASLEPSWVSKQAAAASNLPMGGGSVAFNLRMARMTAQGPSWGGAF